MVTVANCPSLRVSELSSGVRAHTAAAARAGARALWPGAGRRARDAGLTVTPSPGQGPADPPATPGGPAPRAPPQC